MNDQEHVAVVSGGNRGIGKAVCKALGALGYTVILGSRDRQKGVAAAEELRQEGMPVIPAELDVSNTQSVEDFIVWLRQQDYNAGVLVNNAGLYLDKGISAAALPEEDFLATLNVNVLGAFRLTKAMLPLMRARGYGRIVNVSSGLGQLNNMGGNSLAYRSSKSALNAMTQVFSQELDSHQFKVNSICPGWVHTEMGGSGAPKTAEQAAEGIVWAATMPEDGPTGGFFRDRKRIEW
jgi:NAD(P)-dependent dehydrogenase (short-subunit alcohol dehydrogenase family)